MKRIQLFGILLLLVVAPACSSNATGEPRAASMASAPTTAAISEATPTTASIFQMPSTQTPEIPTPAPPSTTRIAPTPKPTGTPTTWPDFYEVPVYEDSLKAGWSLSYSKGMSINLSSTMFVYTGARAISLTPQMDYGLLYFTLDPDSPLVLRNDQVVGISMYINGGDHEIGASDLAISVHGSNARTYWTSGDMSVPVNNRLFFSETRLYDLGITRSIPRDTWVEVILYPYKLTYDPDYQYITGFYLKNDKGALQTIHIDHIRLLLLNSHRALPTSTPSECTQ